MTKGTGSPGTAVGIGVLTVAVGCEEHAHRDGHGDRGLQFVSRIHERDNQRGRAGVARLGCEGQSDERRIEVTDGPVTVIEPDPFEPAVKIRPLVDPSVTVPWLVESSSESALLPAWESVTAIAFGPKKTSEESS